MRCPSCGADITGEANFCRFCGVRLGAATREATTWRLQPSTAPEAQLPTFPVHKDTAEPAPPTSPAYFEARRISLGEWLSEGWQIYKENWLLMSAASVLSIAMTLCTSFILGGPLAIGLYRMAFKIMRGERPDMSDLFRWEGHFVNSLLAFLLYVAISSAIPMWPSLGRGEILAVVGFFVHPFLSVIMSLTFPLMLERRLDVAPAINQVGQIVFSRDALLWWVVGFVWLMIELLGLLACGVGIFVTTPWMLSTAAVAYRDIFGMDDPNRTIPD
jgi:hypothetical protein